MEKNSSKKKNGKIVVCVFLILICVILLALNHQRITIQEKAQAALKESAASQSK